MTEPLDEVSTPQDTRVEMTRLSARGYMQLRHVLVQLSDETLPERGSTLGRIVKQRRHRALLLYMLVLTCWPWLADRKKPLPAAVWIRALTARGAPTWSPSTLSRAWADLEDLGLIEPRAREARAVRVVPRREDGQAAYEAPGGRRAREHAYFILPDAFWKDELFAKLGLPGLAMLLIVAKDTNDPRRNEMYLPLNKARAWYGISSKTAQNGLNDLTAHGLLHRREERVKAPLSATGWTTRVWYSLTDEYGALARAALRRKARTERRARVKGATGPAPRKKRPLIRTTDAGAPTRAAVRKRTAKTATPATKLLKKASASGESSTTTTGIRPARRNTRTTKEVRSATAEP
jgi:hypothetical protein